MNSKLCSVPTVPYSSRSGICSLGKALAGQFHFSDLFDLKKLCLLVSVISQLTSLASTDTAVNIKPDGSILADAPILEETPDHPSCDERNGVLYYKNRTSNTCQECPRCEPGFEPDRLCGEDGQGEGAICVVCRDRHFSTAYDQQPCEPCRECLHTLGNSQCNATRDGICGSCANGFGYFSEDHQDQCIECEILGKTANNQRTCLIVKQTKLPPDKPNSGKVTEMSTTTTTTKRTESTTLSRIEHISISDGSGNNQQILIIIIPVVGVSSVAALFIFLCCHCVKKRKRRDKPESDPELNRGLTQNTFVQVNNNNTHVIYNIENAKTTVVIQPNLNGETQDLQETDHRNASSLLLPADEEQRSITSTSQSDDASINDIPKNDQYHSLRSLDEDSPQQECDPNHGQTEIAVPSLQSLKKY